MRRAARIDANMPAIVEALRAAGVSVQSLAAVGNGCPDLLIGVAGKVGVLEIKDPSQPPSGRRLTPDQKRWHAEWKGTAHVVETVEQALWVVASMRGRLVRPVMEVS